MSHVSLSLPPAADVQPRTFTAHGDVRVDEYSWLQDAKDGRVSAYLKAENDYAKHIMKPHRKLQETLYSEIRSRVTEDDMSVPVKDGPYYYYTRLRKGKQYGIHCRTLGEKGKEEVILDENALAKGKQFFALGVFEHSPDHSLLAYSYDTDGSERFTLVVKDLKTGKLLRERIGQAGDAVWSADGAYLFYSKEEHPHPPNAVYRHELGTDVSKDTLIYKDEDPKWFVGVSKSRDEKYIFVAAGSFDASEVRFLPSDEPLGTPQLFAPRTSEVKYFVEHHAGHFYIVTNEDSVNYKVMRVSDKAPEQERWEVWLPHMLERAITGFAAFKDFLVLTWRQDGSEHVFITDERGNKFSKVRFPEDEHVVSVWGDIEYNSPFIRVTYQSLLTPRTVYDFGPARGQLVRRKKQRVPGWNASGYVSKREWVRSGDALVPVTLAYSKKVKRDGTSPLLLEAYGSYGISSDPYFSITKLSLLKRGWIIATAHPRGGGEMGWQWHKEARLMTKHRTYEDMLAVVDFLAQKKYSSPERMALTGGSAGGMMVGAVLNMRPDLVGAAVAYVPAADLLTSSLDESLAGTRLHYDETGDPRKENEYRYIKEWSVYQNVKRAAYPKLLIRSSFNDIRTPYWEAAKWVAALRAKKTDEHTLLLVTEMGAGHAGKSGRYEWIKERAFDYAFLISQIGHGAFRGARVT